MIIAVSSRTLFYGVHRQQLQYSGGDKPAVHKCRARVLVVVRCYALSTASGGSVPGHGKQSRRDWMHAWAGPWPYATVRLWADQLSRFVRSVQARHRIK